jgi:K+-transporting ATPase c subunit
MELRTEQLTERIEQAAALGDGSQILRLRRERADLREQIEAQEFTERCAELKRRIEELERDGDESKREKLAYEAAQLLAAVALDEAKERVDFALASCHDLDAKVFLASAQIERFGNARHAAQAELSQLIESKLGEKE